MTSRRMPHTPAGRDTMAYAWLEETRKFAEEHEPEGHMKPGGFLHAAEALTVRAIHRMVHSPDENPDDDPFRWHLNPILDLPIPPDYRGSMISNCRKTLRPFGYYLDASYHRKDNEGVMRQGVYSHMVSLTRQHIKIYEKRFRRMDPQDRVQNRRASDLIGFITSDLFFAAMHLPGSPEAASAIPALVFQDFAWGNSENAHDAIYLERINLKRNGWRATKTISLRSLKLLVSSILTRRST